MDLAGNPASDGVMVVGRKCVAQVRGGCIPAGAGRDSARPGINCCNIKISGQFPRVCRPASPRAGVAAIVQKCRREGVLHEFRARGRARTKDRLVPVGIVKGGNLEGGLAAELAPDGKLLVPAALKYGPPVMKYHGRQTVEFVE